MGQRAFGIYLVMITLLIGGCRTARVIRDPEFAALESDTFRSWESPDAVSEAMADVPQWEGARPLGEYIAQALSQNPEIHAIRKRMVETDGINDLRTAAFVEAIDKVAISYEGLGIWP